MVSTADFESARGGSSPSGATIWSLWPSGLGASLWHLLTQVRILPDSLRWSVDYRLPSSRLGIARTSSALLSLLVRFKSDSSLKENLRFSMAGIGVLSYKIEDGCQSGLYFCKDHFCPGSVKAVLVVKQGDGLLDELAVIHGQRHLRDGVVGSV